jgi:hypothetical protein
LLKSFYIAFAFCCLFIGAAHGQADRIRGIGNAAGRMQQGATGTGQGDSLKHRTGLEDSITIRFRYLDSTRMVQFDSSVKDFTRKFPIPWNYFHLGNLGNAAENRFFSPMLLSGWDHGFHAYDIYNYTLPETRFYNTTRPYSEIGYMIGSQAEQMIQLLHTQNIKPNWNAAIQYRLINSPGTFQNQNTSHNNYRVTSWYQSKNKRYQNFVVILGNKLSSGESGGILNDGNYLDSSRFTDSRFNIPTKLGPSQLNSRNFFSTNIATGTYYTNATYLMRQQYDVGQRDSIIVNDSTTVQLFYPRLRFEHTVSYSTYKYRFKDNNADSTYYKNYYDFTLPSSSDTFYRRDFWKDFTNDFSIYQFPDAKNSQQFIKVGAAFQILKADFDTGLVKKSYSNLWLHGEYRNKTRNRKWDIEAYGSFYLSGYNAGDYHAHLSLQRMISQKFGYLKVGFENVNRRPSYVFDDNSSFYFEQPQSFKKENTTHIFAVIDRPLQGFRLSGNYYLLSNYTYFRDFYKPAQASSLFNVLRVALEKDFKLGRKGFHWRTWVVFQQKAGDAEVNLPLILTRNQLAYDGNFGFRNLLISTGLEFRYFTPYKANHYSPLQGQFTYQDTTQISMRMPEMSAFVHFRIKAFTAYARAENLNTFSFSSGGFTRNNVIFPDYATPGLQLRIGIFWSFVN